MSELDKYRGIYTSQDSRYAGYGHSNHGARALPFVQAWKPESLLDVGCGYNEFVIAARTAMPGLQATGVDFACPGADLIAHADALPFEDKQFDVLASFDTLEHIPPDQVALVLREMARVSRRFIFSISYVESVTKWKGEGLHPTVQSEAAWMLAIERAGGVRLNKRGRYLTGEWSPLPRLDRAASVVLVGNGPGVLAGQKGALVDACDYVVRFNDFRIDPSFAPHVGTRTSLWSAFFWGIKCHMHHDVVVCPHESAKFPPGAREAYLVPATLYNRLRSDIQRRAVWRDGLRGNADALLPTSGIIIAVWLLEIVGVEKILLHGFDHFAKDEYKQHHYWQYRGYPQPKEHSGEAEARLFAELRAAGRVEYL